MRIDSDVRGVTSFFGLDPELLQAVVLAEDDIVGAVRRRYPTVQTREEALKVIARCGVRAMCHWIRIGGDERRVAFVANWARWWTFPGGAVRWRNTVPSGTGFARCVATMKIDVDVRSVATFRP